MTSITFTAKDPARDIRPAGPVLTELVQELERVTDLALTSVNSISEEDSAFYAAHPLAVTGGRVTLPMVAQWLDSKINPPLTLDDAVALAADDLARHGGVTLEVARDLVNNVIRIFGLDAAPEAVPLLAAQAEE